MHRLSKVMERRMRGVDGGTVWHIGQRWACSLTFIGRGECGITDLTNECSLACVLIKQPRECQTDVYMSCMLCGVGVCGLQYRLVLHQRQQP